MNTRVENIATDSLPAVGLHLDGKGWTVVRMRSSRRPLVRRMLWVLGGSLALSWVGFALKDASTVGFALWVGPGTVAILVLLVLLGWAAASGLREGYHEIRYFFGGGPAERLDVVDRVEAAHVVQWWWSGTEQRAEAHVRTRDGALRTYRVSGQRPSARLDAFLRAALSPARETR